MVRSGAPGDLLLMAKAFPSYQRANRTAAHLARSELLHLPDSTRCEVPEAQVLHGVGESAKVLKPPGLRAHR